MLTLHQDIPLIIMRLWIRVLYPQHTHYSRGKLRRKFPPSRFNEAGSKTWKIGNDSRMSVDVEQNESVNSHHTTSFPQKSEVKFLVFDGEQLLLNWDKYKPCGLTMTQYPGTYPARWGTIKISWRGNLVMKPILCLSRRAKCLVREKVVPAGVG